MDFSSGRFDRMVERRQERIEATRQKPIWRVALMTLIQIAVIMVLVYGLVWLLS